MGLVAVGGMRTFDLYGVLLRLVRHARNDGVRVRFAVPPGISIRGRPEDTARVIFELLSNAKAHAEGSPVELRAVPSVEEIVLHVDDRGPGIPRQFRAEAFGFGGGLSVARRLMTDQQGTITIRPRFGGRTSILLGFQRP